MRCSCTTLESYRLWRSGEWMPEADLLDTIKGIWKPNAKILLGLAFEKILMDPDAWLVPGGYLCDGFSLDRAEMDPCLDLIDRRGVCQIKTVKPYGDHEVVAKCDYLLGTTVYDWKTTQSPFDADKYFESYQWRFTLDILPAQAFTYQVFLLDDHGNGVVTVRGIETVTVYPYAALHADCATMVEDFAAYARLRGVDKFLTDRQQEAARG